jgi:antitoxin (DNA-binding transcriptional repressor) of toxin-antitoxin stability system
VKFVNVKELHDKTSEILRKLEDEGEEVIITSYGNLRPSSATCLKRTWRIIS